MDQHVVHTCCAHNCGGRAVLQCTVRDGRLVRVEPGMHPDARYTAACVRCLSLPGWVYSEDRLKYPMKRVGERGLGRFERVTWDEALDFVAERLSTIGATHGAASIAFARSSGTSAMGNYATLQALLGSSQLFGSVDMAVHMGLNSTFGFKGLFDQGTNEWTDRPNARTIIVWGHNPAETAMTVFRWLLNARDSGSRLVVVDPRYSATAMHADWWVAPHPGTDTALALGMLHVIIADGLVDEGFASAHSCAPLLVRTDTGRYLREAGLHAGGAERFVVWDGGRDAPVADGESTAPMLDGEYTAAGIPVKTAYRLLREMVAGYTPDRTAVITGVPAGDIRDLARIYATEKPATIAFGYGVDRYLHGDVVTRAGAALAVLTGNLGRPGASVGVASHGLGYRQATLARGPVPQRRATPSIPNIDVGQRELGLRALFSAGDYLNQRIADQNRAIEWIKGLDLVVVADHFWQTTARWADVILPASTFLESDSDLVDVVTWGNSVILKRKVLDPLWESRPDRDIERALAERLGLGEHYSVTAEETIRRRIEDSEDPAMRGITLEGLIEAGGSLRLDVPESSNVQYADLRFGTPSGRAEFYIEDLAPLGEALPVYKADHEAARGHPLARRFPLVLTQTHARQRAHSTFFNNSWLLDVWPGPVLELNPDDAAARGIADSDAVEAYNDRGRVVLDAMLNPDYPPGMCNITEGWKQDQFREGHLQQLVNGRINPAQELLWDQANLPFSDTRVEVRKVARPEATNEGR